MVEKIAWIGLGAMGSRMAQRMASATPTIFFDVNDSVTTKLSHDFGASPARSLKELCSAAPSMIFTCLPTSKEVDQVIDEILSYRHMLPSNALFVDCTSGVPMETRRIGERVRRANLSMVDAPVSGGPLGAQNGTLAIMVGGERSDFERLKPVLIPLSKTQVHVGGLGAGHAVKAINNVLNATHLLVAAEGLATLARMGIDPEKALKVINASSGRSLQTTTRIPTNVLTRKFDYGFKLGLMHKDVSIAKSMVDEFSPEAMILPRTAQLANDALEKFGYLADYTEMVKVVEDAIGANVAPLKSKL